MSKRIVFLQIFIVVLFVIKIAALGEVAKKDNGATRGQAKQNRETSVADSGKNTIIDLKDDIDNGLEKSRNILQLLGTRKDDLDKKEQLLKAEEQKLLSLKIEIIERIDFLRVQEEKLATVLEAVKTTESKRYKDLAKVFEAAPPQKAGIMLEQLDVQTAAGITMNMKRDKAGAIWGYLSPQKAVEITREITRAKSQSSN